jgi:alcohol dehydrogenase, propanol-preferring
VYRSLKETGARPGQFVSITGAGGGLGSLALQYAKALGLRPIAIDFGDTKREHCHKQGAEFFVDAKNQDVVQEVRRVTDGKGPHAVVNIAPAIKPIEDAIKYVRKNGTIVLAGLPEGRLSFEVLPFVFEGLKIKASFLGSRQDMDEALDFMARGLVDIPIEIVGLSELPTALERLDKCQVNGRIVLDTSR